MTGAGSGSRSYDYQVFGLHVRSMLELPELTATPTGSDPDVVVELGPVPEPAASTDDLTAVDGGLVLVVPDVARFRIEHGRKIVVDAHRQVPERNVRLFLLGSAFGALLHQRGVLPLHANAIEIDGKAVAFMGESGAGKSTLAAWFYDRGYRVIADDVCVARLSAEGSVSVASGQPRLRLWKEALEATGRDPASYLRSFAGREDIDKFDMPLDEAREASGDCQLTAIYVLEIADQFSIEPLAGLAATEEVFNHTYRGAYVKDAGSQRQHWEAAIALVRRLPVFRLNRPRDLSLMDENGRRILDHLKSGLAANL